MKKAIVSFVAGLAMASGVWGQTHKMAPTPDSVVRAVGVYEWTGDLAKPTGSRFMPVTVFIDGDLEDGGLYKPQPVPFALLSGNIYELQDAGLAKGTVVLESALHAKLPDGAPGPAFDAGWMAYGAFKPPAAARKSAPLKPSKNLPVIAVSGDSSKPHFSNKSGEAGKPADPAAQPGSAPQQGSAQQQGSKTDDGSDTKASTAGSDDPDRPTMHRRTQSDDTAQNSGSSGTASSDDAERPTLKRRSPEEEKQDQQKNKKKDTATVTGGDSLNDDPDRPRLRHGSKGSGENDGPPKLMGIPKDMRQMVAVSDAKDRDPHPFARPWEDPNERAGVLAKMQGFARAKLAEYGIVPGVTPATAIAGGSAGTPTPTATTVAPDGGPPTLKRGIPPKSSVTTAPALSAATQTPKASTAAKSQKPTTAKGRRGAAASPAQVTLADEELKGYTLSYGGAPTYVYMAHTVETNSVMRYVTVVAQDNGMGELKVALASATDAAHLDRTPWMRLIDAVDVDASNRASLLFELRAQSSRQFGLYRVIAAKPEQIFVSANGL